MSIALHTRSVCDECGNLAIVESGDAFLCERCDREINGAVDNSFSARVPPKAGNASTTGPSPSVVDATFSVPQGTPACALEASAAGLSTRSVSGATVGRDRQLNSNADAVSSLPVMDASETCGDVTIPPASPPFSMPARCRDGCTCADNERCFTSSFDPGPAGFDLDIESAITALENEWARHGLRLGSIPTPPKYATTSRMRALSDTSANLVQPASSSTS